MDMIRSLRCLLDPVIDQTAFILTDVQPLDGTTSGRYGYLEYDGIAGDGRIVLLGLYQLAAWQTITAEMWIPEDVWRISPDANVETVALHRREWSYDFLTNCDALAQTIAADVTDWLRPYRTAKPGPESRSAGP